MPIAYDTTSYGEDTSGAVNSKTVAHTVTGTNTLLLVGVGTSGTKPTTGVTYNSVAMTKLTTISPAGDAAWELTIWGLLNPATGANNIVATVTATPTSIRVHGASYTGVLQSGLPDASGTFSDTPSATSATKAITTVADNCWIGCLGYADPANSITAGANLTLRGSAQPKTAWLDSNADLTPPGSKSSTINFTATLYYAISVVSFAPVADGGGGGGPSGYKSLLGVGQA